MYSMRLASGLSVHVPKLLRDGDTIVYIELLGPRQNVKSNWAAMKNGNRSQWIYYERTYFRSGEHITLKKSLPCGWDHWAMIHRNASPHQMQPDEPFYLINWDLNDEPPDAFYPMLSKAIPIPVLTEWTGWIWERLMQTPSIVTRLRRDNLNLDGYRISPKASRWVELVQSGLYGGHISF